MSDIDFEGVTVRFSKGHYKCPFCKGGPRYPAKKWKTESGFRKHMQSCYMRPSAVAKRESSEAVRAAEIEAKRLAALAGCKYKIGDVVNFVFCAIVKPTHENGRRVRYEEVKSYGAHTVEIKSIGFNNVLYFNGMFTEADIFPTFDEAVKVASARQAAHNKYLVECRNLR